MGFLAPTYSFFKTPSLKLLNPLDIHNGICFIRIIAFPWDLLKVNASHFMRNASENKSDIIRFKQWLII